MSLETERIFNEIVKDKTYLEVCKNISKTEGQLTNLYKDLFQECILILLEKPDNEIIELYNNRSLKFYFTRIVMNQWNSGGNKDIIKGSSPFWNKYRKENHNYRNDNSKQEQTRIDITKEEDEPLVFKSQLNGFKSYYLYEIEDRPDIPNYHVIKKLNQEVLEILDNIYWFDKEIYLIYIQGEWTLSSLSKELGIGRNKINDAIQNCKRIINEKTGIKNKKHIW